MKTKVCTKCKEEKLEIKEFFYFRKDQNSYRSDCIICVSKQHKQYRNLHPEHYKENKDKMLKKSKKV